MSWISAVIAVADYVFTANKDARKAGELSRALTGLRDDVVRSVTAAIKAAFEKAKMDAACNEIEQAEEKLSRKPLPDPLLREVTNHCTAARAALNDPDISLAGHPFYAAAVTLQVTALELLKDVQGAIQVTEKASEHFRNLRRSAEAGVKARFKLQRRTITDWYYTLDGKSQIARGHGSQAKAQELMKVHCQEVTREVLLPLLRAASLWELYAKGYKLQTPVALRAKSGLFVTLSPEDQLWACEDSILGPWARFELFTETVKVAILTGNGMLVTTEAMDLVTASETRLGPLTVYELSRPTKNTITFKSTFLGRYLHAQRKNTAPEWVVECNDSLPSEYSQFEVLHL